jgi:hypothetical protein
MTSAPNYSELARDCLLRAEMAETHDKFEAFLALAEIWKRIERLERPAPSAFPNDRQIHHRTVPCARGD